MVSQEEQVHQVLQVVKGVQDQLAHKVVEERQAHKDHLAQEVKVVNLVNQADQDHQAQGVLLAR